MTLEWRRPDDMNNSSTRHRRDVLWQLLCSEWHHVICEWWGLCALRSVGKHYPVQLKLKTAPKIDHFVHPPLKFQQIYFFDVLCKLVNFKISSKLRLKNSWKIKSHKNVQKAKKNFQIYIFFINFAEFALFLWIESVKDCRHHSVMTDRLFALRANQKASRYFGVVSLDRQRREWRSGKYRRSSLSRLFRL